MTFTGAVGTTLGLVLIFGLLALFCSGITETVSNAFEMRANYLLTGLRAMLDRPEAAAPPRPTAADRGAEAVPATTAGKVDKTRLSLRTKDDAQTAGAAANVQTALAADAAQEPQDVDLTLALFDHPLIKSMQTRRTRWLGLRQDGALRNPQYISPQVFTRALIDTLLPNAAPLAPAAGHPVPPEGSLLVRLERALAAPQLAALPGARSLRALVMQAEGDLTRFEASLEHWYDEEMKRIGGWYKRWSKVILGAAGLAIAVLANVDTVQVAHGLYVNEPLRTAVVAAADSGALCQDKEDAKQRAACASDQIAALDAGGLPIWYAPTCRPGLHPAPCWAWSAGARLHWWDFPLKLLGWGLTAFAVSFGAPFWFDALSRLGSLRNAGPKPA